MPDLFSPYTLKGVTLRNRIAMSPMTMYRSTNGLMNDFHIMLLGSRAAGGFSLVFAEQLAITINGRTSVGCGGIYDDSQIEGLSRVTAIIKDMGAVINARMGLNTWASFVGNDQNAAVAGDVAMLETEVNRVLKTLRKHGISVVAIHHHMTGTRPTVIFLHYWGKGPAEKLATAFKAALDQLGENPPPLK